MKRATFTAGIMSRRKVREIVGIYCFLTCEERWGPFRSTFTIEGEDNLIWLVMFRLKLEAKISRIDQIEESENCSEAKP